MPATAPSPAPPGSRSFLLACALANAGGVIAYLPLLTLLLPIKIEGIAGSARIGVFTATVVAGALAASASNILFGWLSDRTMARGGGRRRWLAAGLAATAASYALVASATSPAMIVLSIVLFQTAVNALLAPLFAIMAEEIPDAQKGIAGGLLALGNPIASALSALLVGLTMLGEGARFGIVSAGIAACVLPLMLLRTRPSPPPTAPQAPPRMLRRDLAIAWGARMMVQVAGNALALYLLYYFESITGGGPDPRLAERVGHLLTVAYLVPLPVALIAGRLSDRVGRRKPFLLAAAIVAAGGLAAMAIATDWTQSATGFVLYTAGSAVFLALHSGFAMQLLPDPRHRGRDLGLLNLANTLPALLGPALTWLLATPRDFGLLMLVLAAVTLGGGLAMLAVGWRR